LLVNVLENRESGYYLSGVEVMIDSIIHPRASDLIICLTHDGVTDTLVRNVSGEGADFLWARLVDGAPVMINYGDAPFSGIYRPYKPLSGFNGLDPDGEWILTVYDSQAGEEGSLRAWGIKPLFEKPVAVEEPAGQSVEQKIRLSQNIPNPFTVLTTISWSSEISGLTTLKVFNINGQEVATLVDKFLPKGEFSVDFNGSSFSPGVYYYKLQIGNYMLAKKCIIL
jgi:hypothetical protein